MTRQRYLAELRRLLVFMTEEDSELVLARYEALLAPAGEDEAAADGLIESLGTPTRVAIRLSRGYEPGEELELPPLPGEPEREPAALTAEEPDPWGDLPTYDLADLDFLGTADAAPAVEAAPETEAAPAGEGPLRPPADLPRPIRRTPPPVRPEPELVTVRTVPLGAGVPLFLVFLLALGVPLLGAVAAVFAALLCPGLVLGAGAWLLFVGGLWCVSYIADAVMLFGAAFVALAAAILILWLGFWLGWKLAALYAKLLQAVAGLFLGRKETVYE